MWNPAFVSQWLFFYSYMILEILWNSSSRPSCLLFFSVRAIFLRDIMVKNEYLEIFQQISQRFPIRKLKRWWRFSAQIHSSKSEQNFFIITEKCSSYWRSANLKDLFLNLSTKVGNFQLVNSKLSWSPCSMIDNFFRLNIFKYQNTICKGRKLWYIFSF